MKKYEAVLSIDFDKTIVDSDFPTIHALRENARDMINLLYDEDFYIIINTCRSGPHEKDCKDFLDDHDIKYHQINQNCPLLCDFYDCDSRKISADIYIDDKDINAILNPKYLDWIYLYNSIQRIVYGSNFKSSLSQCYEQI
jgi:hypothetical protein